MTHEHYGDACADAVVEFMKEQRITCEETIYQCDWVIDNAYEFIAKLCGIVGYPGDEDDE